MNRLHCWLALACCLAAASARADDWITYEGKAGPGKGKHIVLLSGDEEYRSEEGLPMLAKILSERHGFKCTVLFAVDKDGTINPNNAASLPGAQALDSADLIVMLLRFRNYQDQDMKHFVDAYRRGVPIVALRTSTHAFQFKGKSAYQNFNDFGKNILGERWVSHWGRHKAEATRGVIEPSSKEDPILRGVTDVFGDSDVYEAYPPADAKILVRGQVLKGMKPSDPPASYKKKRQPDKQEQDINDPMMPVAWTRLYKHRDADNVTTKIFCTTMGSSTDLASEGLRRLIVNAVYWGLGLEVPAKADVTTVGEFRPTMYGFGSFKKGVKPGDLGVAKPKPDGAPALPQATRATQEKPLEIAVYPGKVPGETEAKADKVTGVIPNRRVNEVTVPTLTVYRPSKAKDTGAAVVIAPGGGYSVLAWDHEGEEVAAWLNNLGVTGIVLKYRVPRRPDHPKYPLQDAQRAISLVRSKAKEWGIDPDRIGMLGFSAGGHLTAVAATNADQRAYEPIDEADKYSCRPDFAVVVYPGGLLAKGKAELVPEVRVGKETPPMFLVHSGDDKVSPENSVLLFLALKRAGVPAELHIYASGGHGYGLNRSKYAPAAQWPVRCEEWLRSRGVLKAQ